MPLQLFAQSIRPAIPLNYNARTRTESKISPIVLNLVEEMFAFGFNSKQKPLKSYLVQRQTFMYQVDSKARIQVTIKCESNIKEIVALVSHQGGLVTAVNQQWQKIEAWMPYQNIKALASNDAVRNIKETEKGHLRTGSIASEGDTLHNTLLVRGLIEVDGSGTTVGVISDGCDNIAAAQATGDLPGSINIIDNSAGGDEGTAMLEIIHDLAPGADLAFSEGIQSSLEFINSINDLVGAGCDVVVDDIGYFGEPWFEEGPIASAARDAITNDGIVYVSSAGNSQDEHYEEDFNGLGSQLELNDVHDYENGDWGQSITVNGSSTVFIFIQWNDPFGSSSNTYRLHLANSSMSSLLGISSTQPDTDDPYAYLGATNNGPFPATVNVVVERVAGSANRRIEMEYNISGTINEYNTLPGSINGQPAVAEVIASGAVRYNTPNLIEYFSSIGPSRIYTYPSYDFDERRKPDLVAVNGNQITGAGGFGQEFPPGSGDIRFFGTSASAPHIAAGAAVVWSAFSGLTNSQVKQRLLNSAIDLGDAGFDSVYGYGRMDVQQACDSPPFTVSGIHGGSDALLSNSIAPGDPLAELSGYIFTANVSPFQAYLKSSRFSLSGTANENDFNGFSLYVDLNDDQQINPVNDSLLSTEIYANPLIFDNINYMFDNTGHSLILTADVSGSANSDHVLNVQLNDSSDVNAYFDVEPFAQNFPFSSSDISLPVQLLYFRHTTLFNGIILEWETASELNTRYFEIERRLESNTRIIFRVDAAGNSSTFQKYQHIDLDVSLGEKITYILYLIELDGQRIQIAEINVTISVPVKLELLPNYPNPFNATTVFRFILPIESTIFLELFNPYGQRVYFTPPQLKQPGMHEVFFNNQTLASGIYFLRLSTSTSNSLKNILHRRIMLLK
jgi:hypothetical protein